MKLVIDRFKESKEHYYCDFYIDDFQRLFRFDIKKIETNRSITLPYYLINNGIDNKDDLQKLIAIDTDKMKKIDYILTNLVDNKFCLLHMRDEEITKYKDLNTLFNLRLKYYKHPIQLIELGPCLF